MEDRTVEFIQCDDLIHDGLLYKNNILWYESIEAYLGISTALIAWLSRPAFHSTLSGSPLKREAHNRLNELKIRIQIWREYDMDDPEGDSLPLQTGLKPVYAHVYTTPITRILTGIVP